MRQHSFELSCSLSISQMRVRQSVVRYRLSNNFNTDSMEELYEQIKQRFERVSEVVKGALSPQRFRSLKDEEKARCEKQNFILSMMRANKATQVLSKSLYYKFSYEIMRLINPQFQHELNMDRLDDNFLNDFVGLYRHFFYKFEEMFNFKLKLQNLIRPTNHNLIVDLVRYLVDFSRDYYQQTFFWYMKALQRVEKIQEEGSKDLQEEEKEEPEAAKKKVGRASLNEVVLQRQLSRRDRDDCEGKPQPQKNYDILEVNGFPAISSQPKDGSMNIEILKFKINQLYRQMKSRNQLAKSNINGYYLRYYGQNGDLKQRQFAQNQNAPINRAVHPYRLVLNIEKSGFNYIAVSYADAKTYQKGKEKRLSPLKISQRLMPALEVKSKADFMLTSLKIIRISDSFLPPLIGQNQNQNQSLPATPNKEKGREFQYLQNSSRVNLISSSSATNEQEIERRVKKLSQHQAAELGSTRTQLKMGKEKSFRKLNELKRSFKSEEKRQGGILMNSNNVNASNPSDPEKKIFDWLQKLRQVKEIERKKIMGLS